MIKQVGRDFESKRDRWAGYDNNTYKEVVEEYEGFDKERRKIELEKNVQKPDEINKTGDLDELKNDYD